MAAITAVVGAGATAYGAYSTAQAQKSASEAAAAPTKVPGGVNFGEKVKAAEYKPVDFTAEQLATIMGNLKNSPAIADLIGATNMNIRQQDMIRAKKFIPNFRQNMKLEGEASNQLLQGRLPYDDVLDIVADRSGFSSALGTPGASAPATLRDLGLSRLDAIKSGAGLMKGMVDIAETVSPIGRYMTPQTMMLSPMDRIRASMDQNQIIQQSEQNKNNLEAGLSPGDKVAAELALLNASRSAGSSGGSGMDFGALGSSAASIVSALGGLYKGGGTEPSGTYMGQFATNPVPGTQNRIYRPNSIPA